jgi:hypothetical protein
MNPEIIEDLNINFEPDAGLKYKFTFLAKDKK